MSEFTKGKWSVLEDGLTIRAKIEYIPHFDAEPPQTLIAKCFQNGHLGRTKLSTKEDLANARLIASAPKLKQQRDDLLKACERLRRRAETGKAITQGDVDVLEAAIAKAKK